MKVNCGCANKGLLVFSPKGSTLTKKTAKPADLPMDPGSLPPHDPNATDLGTTSNGNFKIWYNSDPKDLDAKPAAQELYNNAEVDYATLSKLFGGVTLPKGKNDPQTGSPYIPGQTLVSGGGSQGAYGAYHFGCDSDGIVVDSLRADGTYTPGSDNQLKPAAAHAALSKNGAAVAKAACAGANAYLSSALFVAELSEVFQALQNKGWDCGQTNGEALSRIDAFKLHPEIAKVDGFNAAVSQQWWSDGHPDVVNDNSRSDQDTDGNGGGVMFLQYLNDYRGIPLDKITQAGGNNLGKTYQTLTKDTGKNGFKKMVHLLSTATYESGPLKGQKVIQKGKLVLPPDTDPNAGNPFPYLKGAKSGGLFSTT